MMKWYKASNNLIDDSKLKLVSYKSNVPHYVTIVTFHSLLERCSKNNSSFFGDTSTIVDEISLQCSLDPQNVQRCIDGLAAHGIIRDNILTQWDFHQANTSTERVREWRKKQNETLQNVSETLVTQIRRDKIRRDKSNNKPQTPEGDLPDWLPLDDWNDYLAMRVKKNKKPTPRAIELLLKDLEKWKDQGENLSAIIQNSTKNSYIGLFLPNKTEKTNGGMSWMDKYE